MKNPNHTYPSIAKFQAYVELRALRPRTRKDYGWMVSKLTEHFQRDPAILTENDVRSFFIHVREQRDWGCSMMHVCKHALRCFFRECLKVQAWTVFEDLRIVQDKSLPIVLSRQEVGALLGALREPRFRSCLRLIYHCGLRIGEAVRLEVRDLRDSRSPHPQLHIRNGKGGKDRYVPLTPEMVDELRQWWCEHRDRRWLFPASGRGGKPSVPPQSGSRHVSETAVQVAFRLARAQSAINPNATVHTLRHSYATHLLEEGVSVRQIADYLGHRSLDTTLIYTHLTTRSEARTRSALRLLYLSLNQVSTTATAKA